MNHAAAPRRPGNTLPLVILGAPHSGASILGKAISCLRGSVLIDGEAVAFAEAEPATIESVAGLSERILEDLYTRWDMSLLLLGANDSLAESREHIDALIHNRYLTKVESIIRGLADAADFVVLNDFRVSLFLSLWHEASGLAGIRSSYCFIHRNPPSVANALRLGNNLGMPRSQQIWLRYALSALEFPAHVDDHITFSYENLIFKEEKGIEALAHAMGINPAAFGDTIHVIVKQHQRQQEGSLMLLSRTNNIASLPKAAYLLVQNWHQLSSANRVVDLDELKDRQDEYSCRQHHVGLV